MEPTNEEEFDCDAQVFGPTEDLSDAEKAERYDAIRDMIAGWVSELEECQGSDSVDENIYFQEIVNITLHESETGSSDHVWEYINALPGLQ
jgi:hypothetical protein